MNLRQDLKVVVRRVVKSPWQSLLMVLTLGVVLGANTLSFSFLNEILLNPLPAVRDKARLVNVHRFQNEKDGPLGFSFPAFESLARTSLFERDLVAFNGRGLSLERSGSPELVFGMLVSENYFDVLGVQTRLGRSFTRDDNRAGAPGTVVLSESLWRTRFGADPDVIGSPTRINGRTFTVIGVGPERFNGHFVGFAADMWIPVSWAPVISGQSDLLSDRHTDWLEVFGRLKPESAAGAAAILTRVNESGPSNDSAPANERVLVEPLTGIDRDLRAPVAAFLTLLQAASLLVAVIALVNISSLLLARGIERRHETAVRLALGASRTNLLSPLALEALFLSGAGGLVGVALSVLGGSFALRWLPPFAIPLRFSVVPDAWTFSFSLVVALACALGVTFGPALSTFRSQPSFALLDGGGQRTARSRWISVLVAAQIAFATTILANGAIFTRFLALSAAATPGFDIDRVQLTRLDASILGLDAAGAGPVQQRVLDAVAALPGVEDAALARVPPYAIGTSNTVVREIGGGPESTSFTVDWNAVSPGFFKTLGIPLMRGRAFTSVDTPAGAQVAVISEALSERLFPQGDALGRSFSLGPQGLALTVVGIAADVSLRRLGEEPRLQLYRPLDQAPSPRVAVFARTARPEQLTPMIRSALAQAAPDLPLLETVPLRQFASFSQTGARLGSAVGLSLGVLGVGLAALGLFGLIAHAVASRVREVAIRMAMGAGSRQILSLILLEGGRLGIVGVTAGLLGAMLVSPLVNALVPSVRATDPVALASAAAVVAVTVFIAIWGPAWRASRIAPSAALRAD